MLNSNRLFADDMRLIRLIRVCMTRVSATLPYVYPCPPRASEYGCARRCCISTLGINMRLAFFSQGARSQRKDNMPNTPCAAKQLRTELARPLEWERSASASGSICRPPAAIIAPIVPIE